MLGGYKKPNNFVEKIEPHEEYTAIDLPKVFLLPAMTFIRMITDSSTKTIENPGYLVYLFLNKKSIFIDKFSNAIHAILFPVGTAISAYDYFTSGKSIVDIKPDDNIWYKLVIDYKKINYDRLEDYKKLFNLNKKVLTYVIGEHGACKPCKPKKLTAGDKSDLKLFKPDKIGRDFSIAYAYMLRKLSNNEKLEEWENLYEEVMEFYGKIAKLIEDNIQPVDVELADDYRNY